MYLEMRSHRPHETYDTVPPPTFNVLLYAACPVCRQAAPSFVVKRRGAHRPKPLPVRPRPIPSPPPAAMPPPPPPTGLLQLSDEELRAIFDALSPTPRALSVDAIRLSRTCRRLDRLYRKEYVKVFDRDTYERHRRQPVQEGFSPLARALLRLPLLTALTVDNKEWYDVRWLCDRVGRLVTARITTFSLKFNYGCSTLDDALAVLPAMLPALRHLTVRSFSDTEVTARGFAAISALPSLCALYLHFHLACLSSDIAAIVEMLLKLPRLRRLKLDEFRLSTELLEALPPDLEHLTLLRVQRWAASFLSPICALQNLRSLHISNACSRRAVDWTALQPVAARRESIEFDNVNFDDSLASSCFLSVSSMKKLTRLVLRDIASGPEVPSPRSYSEVLRAAAELPMLKALSITSSYLV